MIEIGTQEVQAYEWNLEKGLASQEDVKREDSIPNGTPTLTSQLAQETKKEEPGKGEEDQQVALSGKLRMVSVSTEGKQSTILNASKHMSRMKMEN